jgi:hypothetical protein
MATYLSTLTRLKTLDIGFHSPTHPKRKNRRLPPPIRSVLPVLTRVNFHGVSEYLEVLAGRIDAPRLEFFGISFFNQPVIDIPQTIRFLSHLESHSAYLAFDPTGYVKILFYPPPSPHSSFIMSTNLSWSIGCKGLDWQVFCAAQIFSQIIHLSSRVEELDIQDRYLWDKNVPPGIGIRPDDIDPTIWLDLFRTFPSVRKLRMSDEMEPFIAAALQRSAARSAPDVFPSLESLSIDKPQVTRNKATKESIGSFVTAREHSGHPVTVHRTKSGT